MKTLELPDIQGIIVRGYRMPTVRYFLLKVRTPSAARAVLGRLTTGDDADAPQVTTAEEWHVATPGPHDDPTSAPRCKPDYCLNVGITWPGLVAMGVSDRIPPPPSGSFDAFVEGAAPRAGRLGDVGDSGPEHWVGGFGTGDDHVMVALYALSPGGARGLQPPADRPVPGAGRLRGAVAPRRRRHGRDGRRRAGARPEDALRVHRWDHHDAADPRRSGAGRSRSPGGVRAMALRPLRGRRQLPAPEPARALAQRELRMLQDDGAGRRRLRGLPAGEQGPDRS